MPPSKKQAAITDSMASARMESRLLPPPCSSPWSLTNGEVLNIVIAQSVEVPVITPRRVIIETDFGKFDVINTVTNFSFGTPNYLYSDQLINCCDGSIKPRQVVTLRFATDSELFNYVGCRKPLPRTMFTFEDLPVPPAFFNGDKKKAQKSEKEA